jgi:hypothetical protein
MRKDYAKLTKTREEQTLQTRFLMECIETMSWARVRALPQAERDELETLYARWRAAHVAKQTTF